jgi:hypothetical protein
MRSLFLEAVIHLLDRHKRSSTLAPNRSLVIPLVSARYMRGLHSSVHSLHLTLVMACTRVRGLVVPSITTFDSSVTVPCNFNTSISVSIGGAAVTITPATFNLGPTASNNNLCLAGAASNPSLTGSGSAFNNLPKDKADLGTEFWVLGDVFLQNVYTAWNFGSGTSAIGFAKAQN